jgi:hypothetical protein
MRPKSTCFMLEKTFGLTAVLMGLAILVFAQTTRQPPSFLPSSLIYLAYAPAPGPPIAATAPEADPETALSIPETNPETEIDLGTAAKTAIPKTTFGPSAAPALDLSPKTFPDGLYGSAYKSQAVKVTGGKAPYTFSVSKGGLPPGMSLSNGGVLSGSPTAAGNFSFTITAKDNSKAPGTLTGSQDYTLVIDQVPLTIAANNATMTYGSAVPALTVSYQGFVNGDNASSLATLPAATTTATSSSPPGVYSITVSGASDPNYKLAYSPGTLTISLAALVVTANAQTKEFGAPDPTFTYTVSGYLNGDNAGIFTGSLSRTPGENVGSYSITKGSLSAGAKYTIGFTGNFLTITTASQQITWAQNLLVGCNGTAQLHLTATASSGLPVTYSVSDANVATVSGNVLTLVQPGTAVITAAQGGNANYAPASALTDTLFYQPASLISQHFSDAIFFDNSSGDFVEWQWYKNGQAVPGATSPYYSESPSLNGQYFVIATNKAGRQIQSCTLTITGGAAIPGGIRVHPNPATAGSMVTVISNYPTAALQGAILQIVDITGKVRQQLTTVQPSMPVTLPGEAGLYIINLLLAGGQRASVNVLVTN